MKKKIFLITTSLIAHLSFAQVLLSEDFNSYPTGHLNTDYKNGSAGQGSWVVREHAGNITAMVTPETGKGNVLTLSTNGTSSEYIAFVQNNGIIDALWKNRTTGNNVLKFEFEFYGAGSFYANGSLFTLHPGYPSVLFPIYFRCDSDCYIASRYINSNLNHIIFEKYNVNTFPSNTWIKIEMYVDYTNKKAYTYIPTLNLFGVDSTINILNLDNINFGVSYLKSTSIVKYDNIKLTAL